MSNHESNHGSNVPHPLDQAREVIDAQPFDYLDMAQHQPTAGEELPPPDATAQLYLYFAEQDHERHHVVQWQREMDAPHSPHANPDAPAIYITSRHNGVYKVPRGLINPSDPRFHP